MVLSVVDRGLVTAEVKRKHILEEHSRFSPLIQDVKNFKGPVLGYVTPVRIQICFFKRTCSPCKSAINFVHTNVCTLMYVY